MASPLLFHVFREDGSITGPHPSAALRRELESGQISFDTQVCMDGTQDWLPLSDWADEIQPQAQRPAAAAPRSAAYAQLVSAPPKNTPLRIFWGVILLLSGISQASFAFIYFQVMDGDDTEGKFILAIHIVLALTWLYIGTRLMMAPKSK